MPFDVWEEDKCGGCGHVDKSGEPHYRLECTDMDCEYKGCHECMPLGRGSRCDDCADPETGK